MSASPTVAIVMSRLPRRIPPDAVWLRGLRAALRRVCGCGATLLIGDGTAGCDFLRRGAERLGIVHKFVATDVTGWIGDSRGLPSADRTLLDAAEMVLTLGVRAGGNLHQLLAERLAQQRSVELVDLPELQPASVRDGLLPLGASLWRPDPDSELPLKGPSAVVDTTRVNNGDEPSRSVCEIVPFPSREDWTLLTHTTRACPNPWPNQSLDDYRDSLLDGRPDADHSAVAALSRLIGERRLIASGRAIRGGHRVVSFTAVPLLDLPSLHRFRSHRGRWDFEPFGLCVRREWLQQRGVRPVVYGNEFAWSGLADNERPYFQLARSKSTRGKSPVNEIDWTVEREWRHEGDLNLNDLPPEEALVFVPNYEAARRVVAISPWPVTLWPDPTFDVVAERQQVQY